MIERLENFIPTCSIHMFFSLKLFLSLKFFSYFGLLSLNSFPLSCIQNENKWKNRKLQNSSYSSISIIQNEKRVNLYLKFWISVPITVQCIWKVHFLSFSQQIGSFICHFPLYFQLFSHSGRKIFYFQLFNNQKNTKKVFFNFSFYCQLSSSWNLLVTLLFIFDDSNCLLPETLECHKI